jgi:hypothetical protein
MCVSERTGQGVSRKANFNVLIPELI